MILCFTRNLHFLTAGFTFYAGIYRDVNLMYMLNEELLFEEGEFTGRLLGRPENKEGYRGSDM